MLIHTISFDSLKKLVPLETKSFLKLCKKHYVDSDDFITAYNRCDSSFLPIGVKSAEVFDVLCSAFDALNTAFIRYTTTSNGKYRYYLELEPQFNDDEMEGKGAYLRVRFGLILSPAAEKIRGYLDKLDLTVVNTPDIWEEETKLTGVGKDAPFGFQNRRR